MICGLNDTIDGTQSTILEERILIVDDLDDSVLLVSFEDCEFSSKREVLLNIGVLAENK